MESVVASASDFTDVSQFVFTIKQFQQQQLLNEKNKNPSSSHNANQQYSIESSAAALDEAEYRFNEQNGFRCVHQDPIHRILMFTKLLDISPIQMMKATAVMPCSPAHFLRYLDLDVRRLWDAVFVEGTIVSELKPTVNNNNRTALVSSNLAENKSTNTTGNFATASNSSTENATSKHQHATASPSPLPNNSTTNNNGIVSQKIQLKHIAFRSPIPILLNRDFELAVCEQVHVDGSAILKAISPPIGLFIPTRPDYVRGVVNISGFVAEPYTYTTKRGKQIHGSRICYVALVHPMGLVPTFFVNAVIGKQTSGLLSLQRFIEENPLEKLVAKGLIDKLQPQVGSVVKRMKSKL